MIAPKNEFAKLLWSHNWPGFFVNLDCDMIQGILTLSFPLAQQQQQQQN